MRRSLLAAAACAALLLALPATANAADLPAPAGTAPIAGSASGTGRPVLTGVRTGRHDGYDRAVFDFTGGTPGYRVAYGTLISQGRGDAVPVAGASTLVVTFDGMDTPALDLNRVYDPQLPALRQIRAGGYFEGRAGFGLGLNVHGGFRVLVLHDPDRIAVDVAQQGAPGCG
ncbi:AMIN-like domain-containing (lipo)protein [Dactylosporangium sp. CA-139066]|uniref:AMIN-like domain-containing (lipo)protein n=1 Tax=Dactylosporangium sp. CA-139066 TaxID=3239930 RepID=UPI003D8D7661